MLKLSFFTNRFSISLTLHMMAIAVIFGLGIARADDSCMVTKEQLRSMLGLPEVIIIDVRSNHDWNNSKVKIPGAVREEGMKFGSWMGKCSKEKTIVLYCA